MIEYVWHDLLAKADGAPDFATRVNGLQDERDDLEAQSRVLVVEQGKAHRVLYSTYKDQLDRIGERLEIIERNLREVEREAHEADTSGAIAAFAELPENLDDLWTWEETAINQLLHRLMGQRRLVLKDGQVIKTHAEPPHPQRKERQRTYFGKNRTSPSD